MGKGKKAEVFFDGINEIFLEKSKGREFRAEDSEFSEGKDSRELTSGGCTLSVQA